MWIRLDCPNGHPVKVDEKFAGRMGRCPMCGEKVRIPAVSTQPQVVSEDDILSFVGDVAAAKPAAPKPAAAQPAVATKPSDIHAAPAAADSVLDGDSSTVNLSPATSAGSDAASMGQQTRICPHCKRKVSVRYQICPHCRTYMPITGIGAGSTILRGQPNISNCPHCGVRSFPGATVCNNCGENLS